LKKLVLFLGSGFSAALGLPTTAQLSERLLPPSEEERWATPHETFITAKIREYWEAVFGWQPGMRPPTLEDHFTQIDLAANSGHHLGAYYDPKKLRAIRRWTIHRVLSQLGPVRGETPTPVKPLFVKLHNAFDLTVVTTNWDGNAEWCLNTPPRIPCDLGVNCVDHSGDTLPRVGVGVLKLHGCASRGYCDCCRDLVPLGSFGDISDAVHRFKLLLKEDDFPPFKNSEAAAASLARDLQVQPGIPCSRCGAPVGFRIGTFSYRKHLDSPAFYAIWDESSIKLRYAEKWLFVGYSLPEADIEIRHLLKSSQLARKDPGSLSIEIVLKEDCPAEQRYRQSLAEPPARSLKAELRNGSLNVWRTTVAAESC